MSHVLTPQGFRLDRMEITRRGTHLSRDPTQIAKHVFHVGRMLHKILSLRITYRHEYLATNKVLSQSLALSDGDDRDEGVKEWLKAPKQCKPHEVPSSRRVYGFVRVGLGALKCTPDSAQERLTP